MPQKRQQVIGAEIPECQLVGALPASGVKKVEQQTKRVAVAADGSRTHISLFDQVVTEKCLDQVRESIRSVHRLAGLLGAFGLLAAAVKSCGVAEKYR